MRIHLSWFRVYIHSLVTITSYDIYPLLVEYPWLYNVAILYESCTTVWPVYSNILSSINLPSIQFPFNQQSGVKSVAQLFKMSLEHNQRTYWPYYYDLHQPKLSTQRWVIFIFFLHNWWSAILVSQCYYTFIFTCLLNILQSFFDCCVVDGSWNSAKGEKCDWVSQNLSSLKAQANRTINIAKKSFICKIMNICSSFLLTAMNHTSIKLIISESVTAEDSTTTPLIY